MKQEQSIISCNRSVFSKDHTCPKCCRWAEKTLDAWKSSASGSNIYSYGFVHLMNDTKIDELDSDNKSSSACNSQTILQTLLLLLLTIVSVVIQAVIPISIIATLPLPDDNICPAQASALTKFIGFILSLFFVALTISMCLGKLRGLGFLDLFLSSKSLGWTRYYAKLGIAINLISMGAAGGTQFMLFIRNSGKDLVPLLLQSLAMQFVLTADEKVMTAALGAKVKNRVQRLLDETRATAKNDDILMGAIDGGIVSSDRISKLTMKNVQKLYIGEGIFLLLVVFVGTGWCISLAYCM